MKQNKIAGNMDTKLKRIASLTCEKPELKFNGLMTYFNKEFLIRCFHELDGKKAVGVDGRAKDDYEENLETNGDAPFVLFCCESRKVL